MLFIEEKEIFTLIVDLATDRLLDVSAGLRGRNLDLTLVFEYIDQDLSTFLSTVSTTGLSLDKIKVSTLSHACLWKYLH